MPTIRTVGSSSNTPDTGATPEIAQPQAATPTSRQASGSPVAADVERRVNNTPRPVTPPGEFNAQAMDALRANMSPTPPAWPQRSLPPSKKVYFGTETEYPRHRYGRRGFGTKYSIHRVPGSDLQSDGAVDLKNEGVTWPEFVEDNSPPRDSLPKVMHDALQGPAHFNNQLVAKTLGEDKYKTTLGEVYPDSKWSGDVVMTIEMGDALPMPSLQATYGVPESKMPVSVVDGDPVVAGRAEVMLDWLEEQLAELAKKGLPPYDFSDDVRGLLLHTMIKSVSAGVESADAANAPPKFYFAYMNRTADSWRYCINLRTPEERAAARAVLMPTEGRSQSLMADAVMQIDGRRGGDTLFGLPYLGGIDGVMSRFEGPTRDKYYASIVEGPWDAMTQLPGANLEGGVGGWLVGDSEMHTTAIENRHGKRTNPVAGNIVHLAIRELYETASLVNPRLQKTGRSDMDRMTDQVEIHNMTKAMAGFNGVHHLWREADEPVSIADASARLIQRMAGLWGDPNKPRGTGDVAARFRKSYKDNEDAKSEFKFLGDYLDSKEEASWDEVKTAYQNLSNDMNRDQSNMNDSEFRDHLKDLGLKLWDCDDEGAGGQARQAKMLEELTAAGLFE